jgi:GNAT superfamily N-acetyltransferase
MAMALNQQAQLHFSPLLPSDAGDVIKLYRTYMRTNQTAERIAFLVAGYPALQVRRDGILVGFCYTNSFAPDVLELCNIYVDQTEQGAGIGTRMLNEIHKMAVNAKYRATILSNSDLHDTLRDKADPRNFYIRNGYRVILETNRTRIYSRALV